jgi:hypothetical protein
MTGSALFGLTDPGVRNPLIPGATAAAVPQL